MNRTFSLMALFVLCSGGLWACCAVSSPGKVVVNADQTVLMIWNAKTQTQHFIRQASFKSDASDVGFLVPSPSKPELAETDQAVFDTLKMITAPPPPKGELGLGAGGFGGGAARSPKPVEIIEQKRVAGFDATVLKADSGESLVEWLKNNQYDYSPAVAAWAKPYIKDKWFFTALKVVPKEEADKKQNGDLQSPGLRISFKTEQPLFPYREPKSAPQAKNLTAKTRTLQIFFIAEGQYAGALNKPEAWSGWTVWSNKLGAEDVKRLVAQLKLPAEQFPADPWLTEFQDKWAYDQAQSDLRFVAVASKESIPKTEAIPVTPSNAPRLQKQIEDQGREEIRKALKRLNKQPKS
jgi:hypothetical protein